MIGLGGRIKFLMYSLKLTSKYMQLGGTIRQLINEGKLPPRMVQNWELIGIDGNGGAFTCPKDQPSITDNAAWFMFDFAAELEEHAQLFSAKQLETIAECVGLAQVLERITRQESDPDVLRKWERKCGRTYTGPTMREQYLAKLEPQNPA